MNGWFKIALAFGLISTACGRGGNSEGPTPAQIDVLARCLADRGVVMYGTSTCSGCRAQHKTFGAAFAHIISVECNPHAEGSEPERCLRTGIRTTPTWVVEVDGQEVRRLEEYQLLEDLARFSGCDSV